MAAVDDLLAQIDHALGDYSVSLDAMRCTPEVQAPELLPVVLVLDVTNGCADGVLPTRPADEYTMTRSHDRTALS